MLVYRVAGGAAVAAARRLSDPRHSLSAAAVCCQRQLCLKSSRREEQQDGHQQRGQRLSHTLARQAWAQQRRALHSTAPRGADASTLVVATLGLTGVAVAGRFTMNAVQQVSAARARAATEAAAMAEEAAKRKPAAQPAAARSPAAAAAAAAAAGKGSTGAAKAPNASAAGDATGAAGGEAAAAEEAAAAAAAAAAGDEKRSGWRRWLRNPLEKRFYDGGFEDAMTRREAALILGVRESASAQRIKERHRQVLMLNHPDRGGSTYMAGKINAAKEILLKGKED